MRFVLPVILTVLSSPAISATMTFSNVTDYPDSPTPSFYEENGIKVSTTDGVIDRYGTSEKSAHMDDYGTIYPSFLLFETGARFDAISIDIVPSSFDNHLGVFYEDTALDFFADNVSWDNVMVEGYRDEALTSAAAFNMLDWSTYFFPSSFTNLDRLKISFTPQPEIGYFIEKFQLSPAYDYAYFTCEAPCSHFHLDNVVLNPTPAIVPLPASVYLLMAAVFALALVRRRKEIGWN